MPAGQGGLSVHKVVLVGDARVGKTSLLARWANNEFSDEYEPTVSPELTTKDIAVNGGNPLRFQVWDIGFGEPEFASQFPCFVAGCAAAVLVYDISDGGSVESMAHWYQEVRSLASSSCHFMIVGCKSDMDAAPGALQRAGEFSSSIGAEHLDCSATSRSACVRVFEMLAQIFEKSVGPAKGTIGGPGAKGAVAAAPSPPPAVSQPVRSVKLVLLGEPGVGKSSLAQRLSGDEQASMPFQEEYVPTAGPEISTRFVVVNGVPVKLQIWDVAGQDLMTNPRICMPVLQNVDASILIYDVCERQSFDSVGRWLRLLEAQVGSDVPVILVGNKSDAPGRVVSVDEGRVRGETIRLPFAETSAKKLGDASYLLDALLETGRPSIDWSAVDKLMATVSASSAVQSVSTAELSDAQPPSRAIATAGQLSDVPSRQLSDSPSVSSLERSVIDSLAATAPVPSVTTDGSTVRRSTESGPRPKEPRQSEPLPKRQPRAGSPASSVDPRQSQQLLGSPDVPPREPPQRSTTPVPKSAVPQSAAPQHVERDARLRVEIPVDGANKNSRAARAPQASREHRPNLQAPIQVQVSPTAQPASKPTTPTAASTPASHIRQVSGDQTVMKGQKAPVPVHLSPVNARNQQGGEPNFGNILARPPMQGTRSGAPAARSPVPKPVPSAQNPPRTLQQYGQSQPDNLGRSQQAVPRVVPQTGGYQGSGVTRQAAPAPAQQPYAAARPYAAAPAQQYPGQQYAGAQPAAAGYGVAAARPRQQSPTAVPYAGGYLRR